MAAISKAWVTIADGAVDPDSPVDATLMTGIRDNLVHLREWLGASFFAGAVQNHNHDGANSASIAIGPNAVRNGSWEEEDSGWTITDYSGGSHAFSTSTRHHGAKSLSFTSTVLANGGGDALSNEFVPIGGSSDLIFQIWRSASVINVSSKAEITWYDGAKASISTSTIYSDTNTPTTATRARVRISSPSGARFWKVRVTGGIPAVGSATGTIFFDGFTVSDWAITQAFVEAAAITQTELKTTTGDVSTTSTTGANLTLPGGAYGFYAQTWDSGVGNHDARTAEASSNTGATTNIWLRVPGGSGTVNARQRYVQASPPYDLGDGEVPLFVFLLVDSLGKVIATYVAQDPPWANNGPTDIRADMIGANGRRLKRLWPKANIAALADPLLRDAELARLEQPAPLVEITQAMKQADMPLIPHPFVLVPSGHTVVLLDPVSALMTQLERINASGECVCPLLHGGSIIFDNVPLVRAAPPGVMPVGARWK